ncbi:hypothetical protein K2Z84_22215 [Candidatus Binatia bacterium]|jgi:hypothetical protein|nr:hypothetical protein [Candidatus Binatia bacterium]
MTVWMRVALGLLLVLGLAGKPSASPNSDLAALTNREFEDYARDRFKWLTGEARSGHHLEARAKRECKPDAGAETDEGRACEMLKAADEQAERILLEGRDLLAALQQRLGSVPAWARVANGQLVAATGRTVAPSTASAAPSGVAPASLPQAR